MERVETPNQLKEDTEHWQIATQNGVFGVFRRQYIQDAKKFGKVVENRQTDNRFSIYVKSSDVYMERLKFLCKKYSVKKFQYNTGMYEVSTVKNDAKAIDEIETSINKFPVHTIRLLGVARIGGKLQKIAILSVWLCYGGRYRCSDERIEYRDSD